MKLHLLLFIEAIPESSAHYQRTTTETVSNDILEEELANLEGVNDPTSAANLILLQIRPVWLLPKQVANTGGKMC